MPGSSFNSRMAGSSPSPRRERTLRLRQAILLANAASLRPGVFWQRRRFDLFFIPDDKHFTETNSIDFKTAATYRAFDEGEPGIPVVFNDIRLIRFDGNFLAHPRSPIGQTLLNAPPIVRIR